MDWSLSFELKPGFSDCVSKLFADLIADLAPDAKLRAALRTAGFELPDRRSAHSESSHDCCGDDMIGPGAVGVKLTASDIEARTKRLFGQPSNQIERPANPLKYQSESAESVGEVVLDQTLAQQLSALSE